MQNLIFGDLFRKRAKGWKGGETKKEPNEVLIAECQKY